MAELVCPTHGPYDASYGTCPFCSGEANRPPAPSPLIDEDDMPTDLGGPNQQDGGWDDGADPTELGEAQRRAEVYYNDEVDPTELGKYAQLDDVTELEFIDTSALAILWVKEGSRRGRIHNIKDGATIGRSTGDVVLDDQKVSNPHAKFTLEDEKYILWDFGSKNGTTVNDERIRAATELKENDIVKIGDTVMVLKVLD